MVGWSLFTHSVSMLLRNWQAVIRIFLLPVVVVIAVVAFLVFQFGTVSYMSDPSGNTPNSGGFVLVIVLVIMLMGLWPIVNWHRYVLAEEQVSGWFVKPKLDRMIAYMFQAFLISIFLALCLLPAFLLLGLVTAAAGPGVLLFAGLGIAILPTWVFMRLSISLVPVALGAGGSGMVETWRHTSGDGGAILVLVLIMIGMQVLIDTITTLIGWPVLAGVWACVGWIVTGLINVSLLTTLYGYYVEKRPI